MNVNPPPLTLMLQGPTQVFQGRSSVWLRGSRNERRYRWDLFRDFMDSIPNEPGRTVRAEVDRKRHIVQLTRDRL